MFTIQPELLISLLITLSTVQDIFAVTDIFNVLFSSIEPVKSSVTSKSSTEKREHRGRSYLAEKVN